MNHSVTRVGLLVLLVAAISVPSFRQPILQADDEVRKPSAEVRALRQERLDVLRKIVELNMETYRQGEQDFHAVVNSQMTMMEAELQLAVDQQTRIKVLEATRELSKHMLEMAVERARAGQGRQVDVLKAQALQLQIKATLLHERSNVS